ncbi:MAG: hypothetical protein ACKOYN_01250 [Planctomycetota bacterium]
MDLRIPIASVLVAVLACAASADTIAVKRLFAPAADVASGVVVLPEPRMVATASQSALLVAGLGEASVFEFAVGAGPIRLIPLGPGAARWTLALDEGAGPMPLAGTALVDGRVDRPFMRVTELVASQSVFGCATPARAYELDVRGGAVVAHLASGGNAAALLVDDGSPATLLAHVPATIVRAGAPLALAVEAWLPADLDAPLASTALRERARAGVPLAWTLRSAQVRWADGTVARGAAGRDGLVRFPAAIAGDAALQVVADVADADGTVRTRSVQLLARITPAGNAIAGAPYLAEAHGGAWIELSVPVATDEPEVFLGTELWAVGPRGERCLGWTGGIAMVEHSASGARARIGFEPARAPLEQDERLECRNLRMHARDGFAPLDLVPRARAAGDSVLARRGRPHPIAGEFGIPGVASVPFDANEGFIPGAGSHVLVLAHGYCADQMPFPLAHFSADAFKYENPNQNMPHDAFARDIAARAASYKSYGLVAHSQGGCAGLHLYAFYWSGLDWAGPGRLIQCVGSPFEGTPMAGNLAALGEVFGVQCGQNYDMTPAGAAAWLSTVPTAPRAKVFTHTTTFTDNWWSFDYCNIVTDAFLSDPEDGVVEHSSGHFPGANDMGIKTGWCHVSGMRDPDQATDAARNAVMNTQGAR